MSRFNLDGWQFTEWLKGNKDTVEQFIKIGVPWLVSLPFFANNVPMQILVTAVGKFVLDVAHYYVAK